jgi:hypothetical protein
MRYAKITITPMYQNLNFWTSTGPKPTANITRGKNRLKSYEGAYFLKDGSNFEIELYNPTQSRVLAKIEVNGHRVSEGGIVVNPGQRVFLERFLDVDRKFEFSTYWVGQTEQDKRAIELNGSVKVTFHQEEGSSPMYLNVPTPTWTTTGSTRATITHVNYLHKPFFTTDSTLSGSTVSSVVTDSSAAYTSKPSPKRAETGRVEMGEMSEQVLETTRGNFMLSTFAEYSFKILPESQRAVEAGEIRNYCPSCGVRIKKSSWKFCPSCGKDLNG